MLADGDKPTNQPGSQHRGFCWKDALHPAVGLVASYSIAGTPTLGSWGLERLLGIHIWVPSPASGSNPGVVMHTCEPRTRELEGEEIRMQG